MNDDTGGAGARRPVLAAVVFLAVVFGAGIGLLWYLQGRMVVEKVLTQLVMPLGLIWIGLAMVTVVLAFQRNWLPFVLSLLIWSVLTVSSVRIFTDQMIGSLERPYFTRQPFSDEPYDVIVVLGGGTAIGKNGIVEMGSSGDRVAMAARMYHHGLTERIVCTGSKIKGLHADNALTAGEQSRKLLIDLNVPPEKVEAISGRNTSEEFENLQATFGEESLRIGLITSAWHLPRAQRLATASGVKMIPVPSDFKIHTQPISILSFLPSAGSLSNSGRAAKEYLAGWVGR